MKNTYVDTIYELALSAFHDDEIPVAAIVVQNGEIIASGVNDREKSKTVTGHAEINAIAKACEVLGDWRLDECEMYVTLFPCMMCAGAILESRIKKVHYLCDRTNVCYKIQDYINCEKIDSIDVEKKCLDLLRLFFENKRN